MWEGLQLPSYNYMRSKIDSNNIRFQIKELSNLWVHTDLSQ